MHTDLQYPFDPQLLLRKRKSIKRELLSTPNLMDKHIAILGGSTTHAGAVPFGPGHPPCFF